MNENEPSSTPYSGNRIFGQRLCAKRKERGLTQKTLAEIVGVHQGHISSYERDRYMPSVQTLRRLAEALECKCEDLMPPECPKFDGRRVVETNRGEVPVFIGRPDRRLSRRDMSLLLSAVKGKVQEAVLASRDIDDNARIHLIAEINRKLDDADFLEALFNGRQ